MITAKPSKPNTIITGSDFIFIRDLHSEPWISWRKSEPWRVKTQRPLNLNVTVWKHHTRQKNQLIRVVSSYAQRNLWIDVDQTWSNVHVRMRWINVFTSLDWEICLLINPHFSRTCVEVYTIYANNYFFIIDPNLWILYLTRDNQFTKKDKGIS